MDLTLNSSNVKLTNRTPHHGSIAKSAGSAGNNSFAIDLFSFHIIFWNIQKWRGYFCKRRKHEKGCFHHALFTSIHETITLVCPFLHHSSQQYYTCIPMATTMLMKVHGTVDKYLWSALIHDINKFVSSYTSNPKSICSTEVWNTVIWLLCQYYKQVRTKKELRSINTKDQITGAQ